jgi:SAM-dependent methyltransferase
VFVQFQRFQGFADRFGRNFMTNPPPNRWDERYDRERYFYGEEPNAFLAAHLPGLPPGNALFLAEGEGRNAVYAALLGHHVLAVDSSAVGRRKALDLARRRGVALEYRCTDMMADDWSTDPWSGRPWDAVVLCFAHLPPDDAVAMHARVAACLAPGGHLLLNSFSKAQLGRTSGGPPQLDWLHDLTELKGQFPGVVFDHAVEREVELGEGVGHRGKAMVIEMVGRKG